MIDQAINPDVWDFGNEILYSMCRDNPLHQDQSVIIGKIWLIGRSYAAAIERRKKSIELDNFGGDFYVNRVAPVIKNSNIDNLIGAIAVTDLLSSQSLEQSLFVHFKVTELFAEISGMEKRSLASKYLHFHRPNMFIIYDSRAEAAISKLSPIIGRVGRNRYKADNPYRKFAEKCLIIIDYIEKNFGIRLSPRQLDNLLLGLQSIA